MTFAFSAEAIKSAKAAGRIRRRSNIAEETWMAVVPAPSEEWFGNQSSNSASGSPSSRKAAEISRTVSPADVSGKTGKVETSEKYSVTS